MLRERCTEIEHCLLGWGSPTGRLQNGIFTHFAALWCDLWVGVGHCEIIGWSAIERTIFV